MQGFSRRARGHQLALVGQYTPEVDDYHRAVVTAASDEVRFLGPVYQPEELQALRFHSLAYVHGHTVGGTNPSLVEALGCGNPVLAHDNVYNRWVAADAALYFSDVDDVDRAVDRLCHDPELRRQLSELRSSTTCGGVHLGVCRRGVRTAPAERSCTRERTL